ncbi:MAG: hypothetical protein Solumvirus9_3 [Solumvirus sp.]|uniref:Uncharacterized protein n=1 Tax=Solumvirus sp. TaxID=2487773 RepID=A0A3G5AJY2_9VIRU|nr:MAG: hypothetical protein Solumvirus9_3 [Solumvirus sp.]
MTETMKVSETVAGTRSLSSLPTITEDPSVVKQVYEAQLKSLQDTRQGCQLQKDKKEDPLKNLVSIIISPPKTRWRYVISRGIFISCGLGVSILFGMTLMSIWVFNSQDSFAKSRESLMNLTSGSAFLYIYLRLTEVVERGDEKIKISQLKEEWHSMVQVMFFVITLFSIVITIFLSILVIWNPDEKLVKLYNQNYDVSGSLIVSSVIMILLMRITEYVDESVSVNMLWKQKLRSLSFFLILLGVLATNICYIVEVFFMYPRENSAKLMVTTMMCAIYTTVITVIMKVESETSSIKKDN